MSQEKEIAEGARVEAFLEDDVVKAAFARQEERLFAAFKSATTAEQLTPIWAQARALESVKAELRIVIDTGTRAKAEHERSARRTGNR